MSEKKTGVSPRTDVLDRKLAGKQRQEYSKSKCKDSFVSKATFPKSREDKSTRSITEEKTLQDVAYLRMGRKGHEHLLPAKLVIRTPELSDVFAGRKQEEPEVVSDEIHSKDKEDRKTSRVGKYRRPIAAGLTLATGLGLGIAANVEADVPSGSFQDVSVSNPYYTAIETMANTINPNTGEKIIDGYPERVFKPENDVTRQQFAKMIVNTLGLKVSEANVSKFKDVTTSGPSSLYPDNYVAKAEEEGIIKGYEGNLFKPYNNITRAQAVTMVIRSIQAFAPDILKTMPEGTHSQYGIFDNGTHYINMDIAEVSGLLRGMDTWENNKDPYARMTRGEVAQILFNALIKLDSTPETTTTTTEQNFPGLIKIDTYTKENCPQEVLTQLQENIQKTNLDSGVIIRIDRIEVKDPKDQNAEHVKFYMVQTDNIIGLSGNYATGMGTQYIARETSGRLRAERLNAIELFFQWEPSYKCYMQIKGVVSKPIIEIELGGEFAIPPNSPANKREHLKKLINIRDAYITYATFNEHNNIALSDDEMLPFISKYGSKYHFFREDGSEIIYDKSNPEQAQVIDKINTSICGTPRRK